MPKLGESIFFQHEEKPLKSRRCRIGQKEKNNVVASVWALVVHFLRAAGQRKITLLPVFFARTLMLPPTITNAFPLNLHCPPRRLRGAQPRTGGGPFPVIKYGHDNQLERPPGRLLSRDSRQR